MASEYNLPSGEKGFMARKGPITFRGGLEPGNFIGTPTASVFTHVKNDFHVGGRMTTSGGRQVVVEKNFGGRKNTAAAGLSFGKKDSSSPVGVNFYVTFK